MIEDVLKKFHTENLDVWKSRKMECYMQKHEIYSRMSNYAELMKVYQDMNKDIESEPEVPQ